MADAHEALGQHMQQDATQEFGRLKRHHFAPPIAVGVVLPGETNLARGEAQQAIIGQRDAMGIATQIVEHRLRPGAGRLGVDDPRAGPQLGEPRVPRGGRGQGGSGAGKGELIGGEGVRQRGEEFASIDRGERLDGKQKARVRGHPLPLGAQRAAADQRMHVQMLIELLAPGMQHQGGGDFAAEPAWVAPELEQRVRRRREQQIQT